MTKPSANSSREFVRKIYPNAKVCCIKIPYQRPMYHVFDDLRGNYDVDMPDVMMLAAGKNVTQAWINAERFIKNKMLEIFGG